MGNYSKLFGAIAGALIGQALVRYAGVDLIALGIASEVEMLATAAFAGLFTWAFPANKAAGT